MSKKWSAAIREVLADNKTPNLDPNGRGLTEAQVPANTHIENSSSDGTGSTKDIQCRLKKHLSKKLSQLKRISIRSGK